MYNTSPVWKSWTTAPHAAEQSQRPIGIFPQGPSAFLDSKFPPSKIWIHPSKTNAHTHTYCIRNSNKLYILYASICNKTIPAQISASFQMKRHFAMRRLPQALLGRQWMPWGISTMRWDSRWFPTWFAMLSCQQQVSTLCKHVAQDFRSGVLVLFVTQENTSDTSVLGTVKVFWGRVGIISPTKTAAYISSMFTERSVKAPLPFLCSSYGSLWAKMQPGKPDPWIWWNHHPGRCWSESLMLMGLSAAPENVERTRNWH